MIPSLNSTDVIVYCLYTLILFVLYLFVTGFLEYLIFCHDYNYFTTIRTHSTLWQSFDWNIGSIIDQLRVTICSLHLMLVISLPPSGHGGGYRWD